jgi:hypothetical protein
MWNADQLCPGILVVEAQRTVRMIGGLQLPEMLTWPASARLVGFQRFRSRAPLALLLIAVPVVAVGQTDEIQVYDAEIAEPGVFNLMIHTNYIPIGRKTPDFPGAIIADHSVNGAAEWAYGVTDWFEQGLYLPVWSPHSQNHGATINGFKLRELFVRPHAAEHKFFYGVNFEFSVNRLYWEPRRITSEVARCPAWRFLTDPNARRAVHVRGGFAGGDQPQFDSD